MVNHESITETHELRRPARLEIDNSLRDDCKLLLTPMASSDVTTTASQLVAFSAVPTRPYGAESGIIPGENAGSQTCFNIFEPFRTDSCLPFPS